MEGKYPNAGGLSGPTAWSPNSPNRGWRPHGCFLFAHRAGPAALFSYEVYRVLINPYLMTQLLVSTQSRGWSGRKRETERGGQIGAGTAPEAASLLGGQVIRALAVTGQRRVGSQKRQAGRGSCSLSLVSPHFKLLVQRPKVSGQWSASLRVNMHIMAATRQHSQSSPSHPWLVGQTCRRSSPTPWV